MRLFRGGRRGIEEVPFRERYEPGQVLELYKRHKLIAKALVLNYDPLQDLGGINPNHWHLALQDPYTKVFYPAAIWEDKPGKVKAHLKLEHVEASLRKSNDPLSNEFLAFSVTEMADRVRAIGSNTTHILVAPPPTEPIALGPPQESLAH